MGKKSKIKSKSTKTTTELEKPTLKNEVVEAVNEQMKHQVPSDLADSFEQSAAFFGKKASYVPVVAETSKEEAASAKLMEKEVHATKKKKKEKKENEAKGEEVQAEDGEKKKKKRNKKKKTEDGDEEKDEKEVTIEDEKARRTVFVGNVSLDATKKDIKNHFAGCGKVENLRLRNLPIAGCAVDKAGNQKLMMKVCANKKILTTAKDNCNAYVTFVEERSVDAALKLNGTILVQKKIRVDRSKPVVDARRSVFLGNVPLKCTDDQVVQFFTKRLKTKEEPEPIENVRIFRDRESGLGKGFGFLLLKTQALVAKTLSLRDLKMENRELRVHVCGKRFKNLRGEESAKEKFEGLRSSAGARARIQLKRKGAVDLDRDLTTKKMKRAAAAAGLGKKLKPKHLARKAAKAAAEAAAAIRGKTLNKRKHDHSNSANVTKPKAKKPKHAARKAMQAAAKE
ncbi:hypothetical protein KXD40_000519 [Peronospora effusa]|uniref:RRM domain-containing protein n=1 Tax=Peronospora effusa TaxID=542832 RepID=A0A3R7XV20_9STRA|nr:hypothetical protein DD237_004697 [Peronospora effusa]UIZ21196.1 hypothetical protein KXD40_000519 [Peronospora effusa]